MRLVEIDSNAGFCGGVIRAINTAEKFLKDQSHSHLYSLGEVVHNESEISRLSELGLVALDGEDVNEIKDASGQPILIRAHGQAPSTYETLKSKGFEIIDCTCPVVIGIQKKIRESQSDYILIFGKKGHPEVLGLVGQIDSNRVRVLENEQDALDFIDSDYPQGTYEIFSQTTKSPAEYKKVCEILLTKISSLKTHNTICSQVANRYNELREFASNHDVVIFVSGKSSSNGKVLCSLCKSVNIRSYQVGSVSEIQASWFRADDSVGISGATSTPMWLLEQIAQYIQLL